MNDLKVLELHEFIDIEERFIAIYRDIKSGKLKLVAMCEEERPKDNCDGMSFTEFEDINLAMCYLRKCKMLHKED